MSTMAMAFLVAGALAAAPPLQPEASPAATLVPTDDDVQVVVAVAMMHMVTSIQEEAAKSIQKKNASIGGVPAEPIFTGMDESASDSSVLGGKVPDWVTSYVCRLSQHAINICQARVTLPEHFGTKDEWAEACQYVNYTTVDEDYSQQCDSSATDAPSAVALAALQPVASPIASPAASPAQAVAPTDVVIEYVMALAMVHMMSEIRRTEAPAVQSRQSCEHPPCSANVQKPRMFTAPTLNLKMEILEPADQQGGSGTEPSAASPGIDNGKYKNDVLPIPPEDPAWAMPVEVDTIKGSGYKTMIPNWAETYMCRLGKRAIRVCVHKATPPHWEGTRKTWVQACEKVNYKRLETEWGKKCKGFKGHLPEDGPPKHKNEALGPPCKGHHKTTKTVWGSEGCGEYSHTPP